MDFTNIRSEILKKYTENKNFLGKLDFWSQVKKPEYFSFKVSQITYRYIKGNKDLKVLEERISNGRLALLIQIPGVKLDEWSVNTVEVIQDIEVKGDGIYFSFASFEIYPEFNMKNAFNQKQLCIFDAKMQKNLLLLKLRTSGVEYIELSCPI